MNAREGFTLIELMIVVSVVSIVAAVSVPSLLKARISANEVSAIASVRTLATVNEQYRTRFQTYAATLSNLQETGYIDEVLGSGIKAGYQFSYSGERHTWNCAADPLEPGTTGERFFFMDQTGVIRFSSTGSADENDAPIESGV